MAQQVRRQMNYVDGTAARQMYAAPARRVHEPERKAPSRRVAPQQRPQERPKVRRRVTAQTKKTLAFSAGYMLFMAFIILMVSFLRQFLLILMVMLLLIISIMEITIYKR